MQLCHDTGGNTDTLQAAQPLLSAADIETRLIQLTSARKPTINQRLSKNLYTTADLEAAQCAAWHALAQQRSPKLALVGTYNDQCALSACTTCAHRESRAALSCCSMQDKVQAHDCSDDVCRQGRRTTQLACIVCGLCSQWHSSSKAHNSKSFLWCSTVAISRDLQKLASSGWHCEDIVAISIAGVKVNSSGATCVANEEEVVQCLCKDGKTGKAAGTVTCAADRQLGNFVCGAPQAVGLS